MVGTEGGAFCDETARGLAAQRPKSARSARVAVVGVRKKPVMTRAHSRVMRPSITEKFSVGYSFVVGEKKGTGRERERGVGKQEQEQEYE